MLHCFFVLKGAKLRGASLYKLKSVCHPPLTSFTEKLQCLWNIQEVGWSNLAECSHYKEEMGTFGQVRLVLHCYCCSNVSFKGHSYPNGTLVMADPQSHIVIIVIGVEKSLTRVHEIILWFFMTTGWDGFFHMWARLDPGENGTVKHAETMALTVNTADGPYFRWTNNSHLTVMHSA